VANNFTSNPIVVDTAMTGGYQAAISAAAGNKFPLYPKRVEWFNPTLSGDTFTIVDPVTSRVILKGRAEAANQSQIFDVSGQTWTDFKVSAISAGGTLYIYV
jgi:hypothetical protein